MQTESVLIISRLMSPPVMSVTKPSYLGGQVCYEFGTSSYCKIEKMLSMSILKQIILLKNIKNQLSRAIFSVVVSELNSFCSVEKKVVVNLLFLCFFSTLINLYSSILTHLSSALHNSSDGFLPFLCRSHQESFS